MDFAPARGGQLSGEPFELSEMIDPVTICSLIIAIAAFWVAWDSRRKTTQHVFAVVKSSYSCTTSIAQPRGFHQFEMYLKNLGLPFPRMSVVLGFRDNNGKGWISCPLQAIDIPTDKASAAALDVPAGLVVQFGWRSHEMNDSEVHRLMRLEDLREQHAVLSVYCAGYLVKTINLASWHERLKQRLQNTVFEVFCRFHLGLYAENQDSWKARVRLPDSQLPSSSLTCFLSALKQGKGLQQSHGSNI